MRKAARWNDHFLARLVTVSKLHPIPLSARLGGVVFRIEIALLSPFNAFEWQ
jgi:hypothetical protein